MTNFVTLDNNLHSDVKVVHAYGAETGAIVNQARIFITEFEELQKEYPIFFRQAENGDYYAVTILGLDTDENLFVNGDAWAARYIPAVFRRGPFKIGRRQDADGAIKNMIQIDLDDARVNKKEGNSLFLPSGGLSPYLQQISNTLETINVGIESESAFFGQLTEHGLLSPITIQLSVSDTKSYTIPDIFSIDKQKFMDLNEDALVKIHKSGLLSLCQWVLSSLSNTNNLLERKLKKTSLESSENTGNV